MLPLTRREITLLLALYAVQPATLSLLHTTMQSEPHTPTLRGLVKRGFVSRRTIRQKGRSGKPPTSYRLTDRGHAVASHLHRASMAARGVEVTPVRFWPVEARP